VGDFGPQPMGIGQRSRIEQEQHSGKAGRSRAVECFPELHQHARAERKQDHLQQLHGKHMVSEQAVDGRDEPGLAGWPDEQFSRIGCPASSASARLS
jgi:hypothetical protein